MGIYQYPFRGTNRITCEWGITGSWSCGWHVGVDIVGDDDTTIYPICEGTVQSLNSKGSSYGNHVVLLQDDGNVSLYAHMSSINVSVGDKVTLNTPLGIMGATGNVTGAHLHLELHANAYKYPTGYTVNTAYWVKNPITEIEDNLLVTDESEEEMRYNTLDELPDYALDTICKLVEKGYLQGDGTGLDLSEDMLRLFVINDRAGLYD